MSFFLILGGVLYAVAFWAIGFKRPWLVLALIAGAAPFQNDISGGGPVKFSLAEINVLLAFPLALARGKIRFGPTLVPALAYIVLGLVCSLGNWHATTLTCLVQTGIYLIIVVTVFASLARHEWDYRAALLAFVIVGAFLSLSVMAFHTPYIYQMHKNGVGASVATAFVVNFELWLAAQDKTSKRRLLLPLIILGFGCIIILSRGAWLTAIVGILVIFFLRRDFTMLLRTVLLLLPVIAIGWMFIPAEEREYATGFQADRENIRLRYESVDFAMAQFRSHPVLGAGVGLRKEYDATNLFMLVLAETGVPGVLTFSLLQLSIVVLIWRVHRRIPKRSLGFSVVVLSGALTFGKLAHGMVDHYWSRGSLTMAWASVGMAARVASLARKRSQPVSFAPPGLIGHPSMAEQPSQRVMNGEDLAAICV